MMKCLLFIMSSNLFLYTICILLSSKLIEGTTKTIKISELLRNTGRIDLLDHFNVTRRILDGKEVRENRPYMVYLKLPKKYPKQGDYRRWLCGGVIIHEQYILTSAACIEDVKHFYVVSGTYIFYEGEEEYTNPCFKNGAKRAVWKCIPRNYIFDGHENDNVRWMNNDLAIVKVEDEFDFERRMRGCDFIPAPIAYNNRSEQYESAGNIASVAGWGSTDKYSDWINIRSGSTRQALLESNVILISKALCKSRWGPRYHNIIDNYMICTKDITAELSEMCHDKYVDCTDIMYLGEYGGERRDMSSDNLLVHSASHSFNGRKRLKSWSGGFCELFGHFLTVVEASNINISCTNWPRSVKYHDLTEDRRQVENDHGGPLVYGTGNEAVVIGVISACLVKETTNKCYGPFLYTSVYRNRKLINCALFKDPNVNCKVFRTDDTYLEIDLKWDEEDTELNESYETEINPMRRKREEIPRKNNNVSIA